MAGEDHPPNAAKSLKDAAQGFVESNPRGGPRLGRWPAGETEEEESALARKAESADPPLRLDSS